MTSYAVRDESEGTVTLNYLNSRTWDCRGQASGTLDAALVAQTGSFYLFAGNMAYSGGSRIGCRCRIMSFTMTRGDEVVMDLIPVRRKVDGKPGMYDVLNDVFYVNQGSMDFVEGEPLLPEGYIGLDFIESTGTQYVNTGVKCASNVTMQAKFYNARSASKHFMGVRTAYQQNALGLSFQVENGSEGYCVAWGSKVAQKLLGRSLTEGVGDHGCEYMTGGRVAVLGPVGDNFAAGMSGGIAWVLDEDGQLESRLNKGHVKLYEVSAQQADELNRLLEMHVKATGSQKAREILEYFSEWLPKFKAVISDEYLAWLNHK